MTLLDAAILGIIQGLTEFLPVSSSGHLVLAQRYLGLTVPPETILAFDVLLHQGTLVAVLFFFRGELIPMTRQAVGLLGAGPDGWRRPSPKYALGHFAWMAVFATLPAIIAAALFNDFFEEVFGSGRYLWIEFLVTTAFVLAGHWARPGSKGPGQFGLKESAVVGTLQAVAILPAVSRSGTTIPGGLLMGLDRETAARFSFIMSVPALLGAGVFKAGAMLRGLEGGLIGPLEAVTGLVLSGVVGFLSLGFLVRIIRGQKLYWFAVYTGLLGLFLLAQKVLS